MRWSLSTLGLPVLELCFEKSQKQTTRTYKCRSKTIYGLNVFLHPFLLYRLLCSRMRVPSNPRGCLIFLITLNALFLQTQNRIGLYLVPLLLSVPKFDSFTGQSSINLSRTVKNLPFSRLTKCMELSLPISDQNEQNKTLAFHTQVYSSSLLGTERSQDMSLYPIYKL